MVLPQSVSYPQLLWFGSGLRRVSSSLAYSASSRVSRSCSLAPRKPWMAVRGMPGAAPHTAKSPNSGNAWLEREDSNSQMKRHATRQHAADSVPPELRVIGIEHRRERGDGRTTELRIRISRPGGGSARCSGSRARVQPRNFFPLTPSFDQRVRLAVISNITRRAGSAAHEGGTSCRHRRPRRPCP
jgi:hypothetical protein